jgi:hypothetical protein
VESSSQSFSEMFKAAGFQTVSADEHGVQQGDSSSTLLLRQFAQDGRFVRTVKCVSGQVTLIGADTPGTLEPFRAALLGSGAGVGVTMRIGSRDLHPTEVHVVGNARSLWSKNSVADVLHTAGVSESISEQLLAQIGLTGAANASPDMLTPGEARRLVLVCSLFSRSQVLYYERPFVEVEDRWVPVVAQMMLEGAQLGGRIIVVTGVERLPAVWKANPDVYVENLDSQPEKTKGEPEIREMLAGSSTSREATYLVTRPQLIHQKRRVMEVSLQAEAIPNPNLNQLLNKPQAQGTAEAKEEQPDAEAKEESRTYADTGAGDGETLRRTPTGSMRRSPSGKLTRVSGVTRIKYSPTAAALRKLYQKCLQLVAKDPSDIAVPKQAQLLEHRRNRKLKLMLLLALMMIVLMLLVLK